MRVLVTGASGLIGSALVDALAARGHDLVLGVRDAGAAARRWPMHAHVMVDFTRDHDVADWRPRLTGIDAVVNTVGILRAHGRQDFEAIHVRGPVALFRACAEAGVGRVVQLSALGADGDAASGYHRSKAAADRALASLPVASTIVRPSLVFAPHGASARWFCRLAALPVTPLPGDGGQCVQPIHLDDLVDALTALVESPPPSFPRRREAGTHATVVDAVGPAPATLRDYLATLRSGMGLPRMRTLAVPRWATRVAAGIGGRLGGFVDRDTLDMLERGNCASPATITRVLGRPPRSASRFVPSGWQAPLRQRAVLDAWLPLLRWTVALTWIVTGIVSLWVFPREESLALLARTGLHGTPALLALYGAGWLDIALGIGTLLSRWRRRSYAAQMLLMLGYTAVITAWLPAFWWHPYGPVLKNLPLLAATGLLYRLDDGR